MIIKDGMIGLSGGNKWYQKGIRFFLGSIFSHSFIVTSDNGKLFALETSSIRVINEEFEKKLKEDNYIEMWDIIFNEDLRAISWELVRRKYLDKWYSYLSWFWFIFRWYKRRQGIELTKMWKWCTPGITCTELTSIYLKKLFPELFPNDINTYTVDILRKIMLENPDKFKLLGWYKEL